MIRLSVVSYNSESPPEPLSATFGVKGGTLGRSRDNDLVLADPKRYVSRRQAFVSSDGDRHAIINLSLTNPIMVNEQELEANRETPLHAGDRLIIGLFIMHVEAVQDETSPDKSPSIGQTDDVTNNEFGCNGTNRSAASVGDSCIAQNAAMQSDDAGLSALLASFGTSGSLAGSHATIPATPAKIAPEIISEFAVLSSTQLSPVQHDLATPAPAGMAVSFDDLLNDSTHGARLSEHAAPLIPDSFDPFDLPSQAVRNSDDPLGDLVASDVTLASFEDRVIGSLVASASDSRIESFFHTDSDTGSVDPMQLFSSDSILPVRQSGFETSKIPSNHVAEIDAPFLMPVARGATENHGSVSFRKPLLPETGGSEIAGTPIIPEAIQRQNFSSDLAQMLAAVDDTIRTRTTGTLESGKADGSEPGFESDRAGGLAFGTATDGVESDASGQQHSIHNGDLIRDERQALMQAFIEGANIPEGTIAGDLTPELMRSIGQILASATQGTVELISSRALVKREVKADVTMIVVKNNNPLKFLPDGQTALMHMFGRKIPGFMEPVEAINDAYQDLRAHQIGVVAGMRAALNDVLQRFDPQQIDVRDGERSLIDTVIPINRKARMWDRYNALFQQIQAEAQDDFQTLFGKAFLLAYDEEIGRFEQDDA